MLMELLQNVNTIYRKAAKSPNWNTGRNKGAFVAYNKSVMILSMLNPSASAL